MKVRRRWRWFHMGENAMQFVRAITLIPRGGFACLFGWTDYDLHRFGEAVLHRHRTP